MSVIGCLYGHGYIEWLVDELMDGLVGKWMDALMNRWAHDGCVYGCID